MHIGECETMHAAINETCPVKSIHTDLSAGVI